LFRAQHPKHQVDFAQAAPVVDDVFEDSDILNERGVFDQKGQLPENFDYVCQLVVFIHLPYLLLRLRQLGQRAAGHDYRKACERRAAKFRCFGEEFAFRVC
jgi:hypothetical protein